MKWSDSFLLFKLFFFALWGAFFVLIASKKKWFHFTGNPTERYFKLQENIDAEFWQQVRPEKFFWKWNFHRIVLRKLSKRFFKKKSVNVKSVFFTKIDFLGPKKIGNLFCFWSKKSSWLIKKCAGKKCYQHRCYKHFLSMDFCVSDGAYLSNI